MDEFLQNLHYLAMNYDPIFFYISDLSKEQLVINDPEKKCRFCDKKEPEVTFKKTAHALPELIGNKKIKSNNECDICNEKISAKIEDSLGKYLGVWRTMMQIRGKRGVASYKSPDGISRIDRTEKGIELRSFIDDPIFEQDEVNKIIRVKGYRQPYTPIAVYKCFVKMAISVMPYDLLSYFHETKKWVIEDSHIISKFDIQPIMTISSFVPGPNPFGSVTMMLYKRKYDHLEVPFMQMVIAFNNLSYQIVVPCVYKDFHLNGKTITVP